MKPWESYAYMKRLYWQDHLSPEQIAEKLGCSHMTVRRWLKKHKLVK